MAVPSRVVKVAGLPALSTGPSVCNRAVAMSESTTRAVMPTITSTIALTRATATILKWVVRSAPMSEWVILVPPRVSIVGRDHAGKGSKVLWSDTFLGPVGSEGRRSQNRVPDSGGTERASRLVAGGCLCRLVRLHRLVSAECLALFLRGNIGPAAKRPAICARSSGFSAGSGGVEALCRRFRGTLSLVRRRG